MLNRVYLTYVLVFWIELDRGSVVGIVTCYGWTVRGSNTGGARFSAPVQTGPGAHPVSHTMGFPEMKAAGA